MVDQLLKTGNKSEKGGGGGEASTAFVRRKYGNRRDEEGELAQLWSFPFKLLVVEGRVETRQGQDG